jgi:hypothetical protein
MRNVGWIVGWDFKRHSFQLNEKNGGDDGTRTRGLCRDRVAGRCNLLELNGTDSPFLAL